MTCTKCRNSEQLREAWGCDRESQTPIAEIECPRCGDARVLGCGLCAGRGRIPIFRCPNKTVPPIYFEAVSAVVMADRGLGMPCAGGTLDQAAWFISAMAFVQAAFDEARKPTP